MDRSLRSSLVPFALALVAALPAPALAGPAGDAGKATAGVAGAAAAADAIAVEGHEVDGVQVALLEVRRTSGDTVTVKWQYRNTTGEKKKLEHGATVGLDAYRFARDAHLLDTVNRKKHGVLEDDQGVPLAAQHDAFKFQVRLDPGQKVNTWAKFSAPPADVKKVTVSLPGAPPFEDVTIAE